MAKWYHPAIEPVNWGEYGDGAGRVSHPPGVTTDAVINAATKSPGLLSLAGTGSEIAEEGLAGPIGWGKLALDGIVFLGSAAYCAAAK